MSSVIRHHWIESALVEFRSHFRECGYTVPEKVRVSVGFTKSNNHAKSLGQCVDRTMSADDHYELFVSPIAGANGEAVIDKASTINILETIAHELVHATVGNEEGHQGAFIGCAVAVGFTRPWRYTPAGAIKLLKKPQGKSLIKCQCEGCDYVAYVTRKQFEASGTPVCPNDFEAMWCE